MNTFIDKVSDVLLDIAEKIDGNKYLIAIKNSFSTYLPFIIAGSFASLFNNLLCSETMGLAAFIPALKSLSPAFNIVNFVTMSCMTLPIVYLIGMNLGRQNKISEQAAGVLALMAYLTVGPNVVSVTVDGVSASASGLAGTVLGAQGMFTGMFVGALAVEFLTFLTKFEKLKIKMPASVPPAIATSFNTLIPITLTLLLVAISGGLFKSATGMYINDAIYALIQSPMEALFQSPLGILGVVTVMNLFWWFGIHGGLVISPIRNPLWAAAIAANVAAASAGTVPNQPVTMGFWVAFTNLGATGNVLALAIALLLFSKREDYKSVAKVGFIPGLFCIAEPIIYGIPLILNTTFALPLIFSNTISTGIALFFTKIGFLSCNVIDAAYGLPVIINAIIGHGWQGVVVQIICMVVGVLVWMPFVLLSNRQYEKEQAVITEKN